VRKIKQSEQLKLNAFMAAATWCTCIQSSALLCRLEPCTLLSFVSECLL